MNRVTKIRLTQISKICCTYGRLCCSDQQIFPPQLAETLANHGVGIERCIPKNIPTKKHSYSLPLRLCCFLWLFVGPALFLEVRGFANRLMLGSKFIFYLAAIFLQESNHLSSSVVIFSDKLH
jgi:hypothetical protein